MTITAGKRHMVPRGVLVYDHVRKTESKRCTSYPVHVQWTDETRVYWFGDCGRLMSCALEDIDLRRVDGPRSPRRRP